MLDHLITGREKTDNTAGTRREDARPSPDNASPRPPNAGVVARGPRPINVRMDYRELSTLAHRRFGQSGGEYDHCERPLKWMAKPPPGKSHLMKVRSSKRWQHFGRDLVLGGFASVTTSRAFGGNADEVNALLRREQESAKISAIPDVGQASLIETTGSRPEKDDLRAIERGEDEGMVVGRE